MKTSIKSAAFRNTAIVFLFVLPIPLRAQDPVVLEGEFGKAEVDVAKPALSSLTLRRADGSLEPHSLLSPKGAAWLCRLDHARRHVDRELAVERPEV